MELARALAVDTHACQLPFDFEKAGALNSQYLSGSGYFSINYTGKKYLRQEMYPIDRMPWVLEEYAKLTNKYDGDFYGSMATFFAKKRRAALLKDVSIIWIDFDYYKTELFGNFSAEQFNALIENVMVDAGVPLPSFTVSSGRGIYANWILSQPLPSYAITRWQAVMRELNKKFAIYGADPKAIMPTQIMRVVGSLNMRQPQWYPTNERQVRVLECRTDAIGKPISHNFEYLAECILPYTRDEVKAYKASKHKDTKIWNSFAVNTQLKNEYLQSIRRGSLSEVRPEVRLALAGDESCWLWWHRLMAMRKIAQNRGGIEDGQGRNNWCWIASNAMGYSHVSSNDDLKFENSILIKEIIPSYTCAEIARSASAISNRIINGEHLYKMTNETFCNLLNITRDELKDSYPKFRTKNEGIMGFEIIKDETFPDYLKITKARQSLSADRTNFIKNKRNESKRHEAILLHASGMSSRNIAKTTGFSQRTIIKWVR